MANSSSEEPEVEYENEEFVLGPYLFNITTISFMPIEILMKNQTGGTEISGQKLWCGSLCSIAYLFATETVGFVPNDAIVIELGAGTGVLGMISSRLGAKHVYLSDHDEKSIENMQLDLDRNGFDSSSVSVRTFDWCNSSDCDSMLQEIVSCGSPVRLLAGDVLYKRALLKPFFSVVRHFFDISDVDVQMVLCHVPRAGVTHEDICTEAKHSFGLELVEQSSDIWMPFIAVEYCPLEDLERSKVYRVVKYIDPRSI